MAVYVMSDIHGNIKEFKAMLDLIDFNTNKDRLYLLGDYVDWGNDSISLLLDLIDLTEKSQNVICLKGNHDLMMEKVISRADSINEVYNIDDDEYYMSAMIWFNNCGDDTLIQYSKQTNDNKLRIKNWIKSLQYVIPDIEVAGRKYYLCHSMPLLGNMELKDVVWDRVELPFFPSAFKTKYPNTTLISGHTITKKYGSLTDEGKCKIYKSKRNPYINIDCGAKGMGIRRYARLACLRLDDMKEYYVDRIKAVTL